MDLSVFLYRYSPDSDLGAPRTTVAEGPTGPSQETGSPDVFDLLTHMGGMSFGGGTYRLHRLDDLSAWNSSIGMAWPKTKGRVTCFAYDWAGRQFALFEKTTVLQFNAGDLEWTEIPADLKAFHNEILVEMAEPALGLSFFEAWLGSGGARPMYSECIGCKRPLFLGGSDWIDNLEVIDLEVYWTVSAPIITKSLKVGVGGSIGRIDISE